MAEPKGFDDRTGAPSDEDARRLAAASLDVGTACLYWFDLHARIVFANDAACRTLGYTREEFSRLTVSDINPTYPPGRVSLDPTSDRGGIGADGAELPPWARGLVREGVTSTYETVHRHKSGRLVPVEVSARLCEAGGRRYLVAVVEDISSRRRMEAAVENVANELDRFFETSSDLLCIADLRGFFRRLSPGWASLMGFAVDELLAKPYIEFVHPDDRPATLEAARRLVPGAAVTTFSNRFLQKDGAYRWLEWRTVVHGERIYAAATDVSSRAATEDALRRATESADAASRAKADLLTEMSHELRTPLNVIVGMCHLALATTLTPQQRDYLTKLQSSATSLTDIVGRSLECADAKARAAAGPASRSRESRAAATPAARVLVVEDNRLNQRVAREMLERLGIEVATADDGRQAVEAVRREPDGFDAILMDVQMPEMDGLEATRIIRREHPHRAVGIIAATANALPSERDACLESGMNDYVSKPIDPKRLEAALSPWMDRGRAAASRPAQADDRPSAAVPALTALRGVDIGSALARLNGKQDLFVRLLRGFVEEHGTAAAVLGDAIARGDFASALRLAHDLKGVAGTLSANAVYEAARALEVGLRQNQHETLPAHLERLSAALEMVCRSASEWSGEVAAPSTPPERPAPASSAIAPVVAEFDRLLRTRRFAARKQFELVREYATGPAVAKRMDEIQSCLDRLDFGAAREALASVADTLGVPLPRA